MGLDKNLKLAPAALDKGAKYVICKDDDGEEMAIFLGFLNLDANSAYTERVATLSKPFRREISAGRMDPETDRKLGMTAFAECVVKGWTNMFFKDKKDQLEYTLDNVMVVLERYPDEYGRMRAFASDSDNFKESTFEDDQDLGNDSRTTSGTNSGSPPPAVTPADPTTVFPVTEKAQ